MLRVDEAAYITMLAERAAETRCPKPRHGSVDATTIFSVVALLNVAVYDGLTLQSELRLDWRLLAVLAPPAVTGLIAYFTNRAQWQSWSEAYRSELRRLEEERDGR